MTKQELEKAIEKGESVWCVLLGRVEELKDLKFVGDLLRGYNKIDRFYHNITSEFFNGLYKTKAEAEHYLHHANVSRTETLPFLTWEEFKEIGQISFTGKDKKEYILKKDITWSNNKYTLVDCLKIVNETDFTFSKYFDYTEANFYKAYDECVRLFKGGEQL